VGVFYSDDRLAGLHFANRRGVPHLGISAGIFEIAPEVAIFMNRPDAAPIVLKMAGRRDHRSDARLCAPLHGSKPSRSTRWAVKRMVVALRWRRISSGSQR
jgi:hypothetical protein